MKKNGKLKRSVAVHPVKLDVFRPGIRESLHA